MDLNHLAACSATSLIITIHAQVKKVEDIGVEPMTLCVQGRCSSQLS
jgi:hypothetical protein